MKFTIVVCLVLLGAPAWADESTSYEDHMAVARTAFAAEDWDGVAASLDAAQLHRPYSLYLLKNRVLAYEMKGDRDRALQLVRMVAERGLSIEISGHDGFDALRNAPAFEEIAARMNANTGPKGESGLVMSSRHYFAINEALSVDADGMLVTGSVTHGDIVQSNIDRKKRYPSINARGGVFDIELRDETIWAAVNSHFGYVDRGIDRPAPSASIVAFNRTTGSEIAKIRLGGGETLIGDIEIAGNGVIYASDSKTPRILKIEPGDENRVVKLTDPRFVNLQGIALDEENSRIFIADYLTGLWVMDLEGGAVQPIRNDANLHLGGIDGLYYYKNDLIGIQNGTTPHRIVRIKLSDNAAAATGLHVLAQNLPEWNEPTHGVVVDDEFYYIATSNWPSYDPQHDWSAREDNPPQSLRVMSVDLN